MDNLNPIYLTDSYKLSHDPLYPPDLEWLTAYLEARYGMMKNTVWLGLQGILKEHGFVREYGDVYHAAHVVEAKEMFAEHMGNPDVFNDAGFKHIVRDHNGRPPIKIQSIPEGMTLPIGNALMTVEPTCKQCRWYPTFTEPLWMHTWYPTTIGSMGLVAKDMLRTGLIDTGGDPALADWMLHDFGFRGTSSVQSAARGGAAHLAHFLGTDTVVALEWLRRYYHVRCAGHSIPATEHSTHITWGRDRELESYRNAMEKYPRGPLACVGDSYDIDAMLDMVCGPLKPYILARQPDSIGRPGRFLPRTDGEFPPDMVVRAIDRLGDGYGYATNKKGYKVLHPAVRVVHGDGMDIGMIQQVIDRLKLKGWAVENVGTFGMGGGRLQKVHRDMQGFAMKPSEVVEAGQRRSVFKSPKGSPEKNSKAGQFAVVWTPDGYKTVPYEAKHDPNNLLRTVYEDGRLLVDDDWATIKARASRAVEETEAA